MRTTLLMAAGLLAAVMTQLHAQTSAPDTGAGSAPPQTGRVHHRPRHHTRPAAAQDPENPGGQAPADQYTGVPPTSAFHVSPWPANRLKTLAR